jgi:hypothetical protein
MAKVKVSREWTPAERAALKAAIETHMTQARAKLPSWAAEHPGQAAVREIRYQLALDQNLLDTLVSSSGEFLELNRSNFEEFLE